MKELLAVISLVLSGAVAEAPYPPSGFRPAGPAFELPQKVSQNPNPQQQEYLPPVDPRRPLTPSTQYGAPEEDVSVQGLPTFEQRPIFQVSPVNGQQYVGPNFNSDVKNLDESYRRSQYQQQQEQYREFERQRQLEAAQARSRANQVPTPQVPRQFGTESTVSTTEVTTKNPEDFRTTESTTESVDLNEGETLDDKRDDNKSKVTVEVSKQNVQEYPGELFLTSLAQLQLQPQFVQLGQIRAPLYFQPIQQETSQKQVASYDAATHFAALPSILAQQQYIQGLQAQQSVVPSPGFQQQVVVSGQDPDVGFVSQNPQPQFVSSQYQPVVQQAQSPQNQFSSQYQPQPQTFQQPIVVQPQSVPNQFVQVQPQEVPNQFAPVQPQSVQPNQYGQPKQEEDEQQNEQRQPQLVYQQSYQPQEVIYQPQQYQPQPQQQQINQYQPQEQQTVFLQAPQPQTVASQYQPQPQIATNQYQPQAVVNQYQPQPAVSQYQPQAVVGQYQPQFVGEHQPQAAVGQYQPQAIVSQYQPQTVASQYQPQTVASQYQPQPQAAINQYQTQEQQNVLLPQAQLVDYEQIVQQYQNGLAAQYQNGFAPQQQFQVQPQIPQQVSQGQDSLQSGLDLNQQGNGIEQTEEKDEESDDNKVDDGATSVAVATAFGTRTQPRVFTRYGAPVPAPRSQANPQATTEAAVQNEQADEDTGSVAQANVFASGRRKSAKLRSRRVRPVFTLDRSGHLVLAQEQN